MIASSYMNSAKDDAEDNGKVKGEGEDGEGKTKEEQAEEDAKNALNTACKNVRK